MQHFELERLQDKKLYHACFNIALLGTNAVLAIGNGVAGIFNRICFTIPNVLDDALHVHLVCDIFWMMITFLAPVPTLAAIAVLTVTSLGCLPPKCLFCWLILSSTYGCTRRILPIRIECIDLYQFLLHQIADTHSCQVILTCGIDWRSEKPESHEDTPRNTHFVHNVHAVCRT